MQTARLRARYRHIMGFFARATAGFIFWEVILPRLGLRTLARRTRSQRYTQIASRFRTMAIRMGGVMIKVGQFLSARADVLPVEITEELSGLQDEVPAEDFDAIRALAEAELGARLEEKFERFEPEPLAAASLGQVHRARLRLDAPEAQEFQDVVVKIQRPFIDQLIEVDFSALHRVAGWLMHYKPISRRVDVRALISELETTVYREIDYLSEGKNAETFNTNFAESKRLHVPRVVWSRTTKRVLTLENVYAIKITDYEAITSAGIDRAEVQRLAGAIHRARDLVNTPAGDLGPTALAAAVIVYGFAASALPVWLLLAPRDYLSAFIKVGVVLALVVLSTTASIVAAAGFGLIAFVPVVGLIVLPLQLAAWLLRGALLQYLGLTTLGAYLAQYRAHRRQAGVDSPRPTPAPDVEPFPEGRTA